MMNLDKIENNKIYVKISSDPPQVASDHYAHMGLWKIPIQTKPPKRYK
jgi:hypothetical protein